MTTELSIRMTADASDAARAADEVGDAWGRMASDVDAASSKTDAAASRMDSMADSTDTMATRSAQAAGGIGDLAGSLETMGFISEGTAMALEAGAASIMGVTGAADLLNLVTTSSIVIKAKDTVATIRSTVASRAQAAATRASAVAQRVLNAAMRANPIGLVITAVLLVAGALVLAYKRSQTFRNIVQAVFRAVSNAVTSFIGVVGKIVGWLRDKVPAAAAVLRERVTGVWQAVRDKAGDAWDWVRNKVADVVDRIKSLVGGIVDKVRGVGADIRSLLGGAFQAVRDKVQPIIDAVQSVIDLIGRIKLPSIGSGRGGGGSIPISPRTVAPAGPAAPTQLVQVTVNGALDPDAVARQIERILSRRTVRTAGWTT